jgi:hypothetical protein
MGLAWVTEMRVDAPKHKARTQMMHERASKPFVQPVLATGPGWCFGDNSDERGENIVVVGSRKFLCTQRCVVFCCQTAEKHEQARA